VRGEGYPILDFLSECNWIFWNHWEILVYIVGEPICSVGNRNRLISYWGAFNWYSRIGSKFLWYIWPIDKKPNVLKNQLLARSNHHPISHPNIPASLKTNYSIYPNYKLSLTPTISPPQYSPLYSQHYHNFKTKTAN
jgi:hypothetical protein